MGVQVYAYLGDTLSINHRSPVGVASATNAFPAGTTVAPTSWPKPLLREAARPAVDRCCNTGESAGKSKACYRRFPSRTRQGGFGLIAAIFVMLIVAGAIAAMMQLSTTQHGTVVLALQQARAYQAARAGVEWGIGQVAGAQCADKVTKENLPGLAGFKVVVKCEVGNFSVPEEGGTVKIYEVISTAEYGQVGTPDYAFRRLSVVVE